MGKTIQTLALFVKDRKRPNLIVAYVKASFRITRLTACSPTVAIMQWKNEIDTHTTGFKVHLYHGASRMKDQEELCKFDVVLTTYSVMESVYRKQQWGFKRKGQLVKEKSILHGTEWCRIIVSNHPHPMRTDLTPEYSWTKHIISKNVPLIPLKPPLSSRVNIVGVFLGHHCRIEWESCIVLLDSWVAIRLAFTSVSSVLGSDRDLR